jgi:hypothetical protein
MKYSIIVLISFSLLLAGCSSNQVTLTMRDGAKIESELLSVRDSAIVIQEKGGAPIAIPYSDFTTVSYDAGSSLPYMIGGSLVVGGIGAYIGAWDFQGLKNEPSSIISGALIGGAAGWVIGGMLSPNDKTFDINKLNDRRKMIEYSKYHPYYEPDELKKIK